MCQRKRNKLIWRKSARIKGLSKLRSIASSRASDVESDRRGQRWCKSDAARARDDLR